MSLRGLTVSDAMIKPMRMTEYLSHMKVEVEILKVRSWRKKDEAGIEILATIDGAISGIMNEMMEL